MPTIGLVGKGGTGKTTIAALLLSVLMKAGVPGPILGVDADPASTLHYTLGVPEPRATVAGVREQLQKAVRRRDPEALLRVQQVLDEAQVIAEIQPNWHLLAMGQGEGPGCYCSVNANLGVALEALLGRYTWIVIDNEAGVEHLSRCRIQHVDAFLVVAQPARVSQQVARRILDTAQSVGITWQAAGLILNRSNGENGLANGGELPDLPLWARIPDDQTVGFLEMARESPHSLEVDFPALRAVRSLMERIHTELGVCEGHDVPVLLSSPSGTSL